MPRDKTLSIQCPNCSSTESGVTNTYYNGGVSRRRKCKQCGWTYKTLEILDLEYQGLKLSSRKIRIDTKKIVDAIVELEKVFPDGADSRG